MDPDATAIREIEYDPDRTKLVVRLETGEAYVFVGVPDDEARALRAAEHPARVFRLRIRDRYPFNRLDS